MVGTLTVQNLQGPASGANANKIIIPAGQTLDASAGTMVPSAGAVIQVVNMAFDTRVEYSGASTANFQDTGITATITPSSLTNKILVIFTCGSVFARLGGFHQEPDIRLVRNSSELKIYPNLIMKGGNDFHIPNEDVNVTISQTYLDSPSTTSSTTYKVQIRGNTNISGDMRVGINGVGNGTYFGNTSTGSSMTLMEIAG